MRAIVIAREVAQCRSEIKRLSVADVLVRGVAVCANRRVLPE